MIKVGDRICVYNEKGVLLFTGNVKYMPSAPGDTWIIEDWDSNTINTYYVQSFGFIQKKERRQ